uniref:Wax synthase domain-containing protein n=1 Tax=Rhizophagus irregularis (strain DAOM 181602 / DAOM 197198 / MUCL 43194) TaxID=747089 RepID=U9TWR9_RHIID
MLIWLKKSLNDPSYIKPFVWSLFYWRAKEGNIPIMRQDDLLKQGITKDRLESYINRHYIIYLCVWILYMICAQFSELFVPDIPKTSFPIRVIETLTNDQLNSLKLWLISLLFYSKPIFNQPYLSENPRELWSIRWHQMFHEIFVELGYKPACYLFSSFPAKLQKIFGTLASFAISGILHEYILYSSSRYLTLEQFTYFLFNAIVMMIWESFSKFRLDQGQKFLWKRIRDSLFMTVFVLFTLPWFIEPYIKCEHYHSLMHFICRKFKNFIFH